MYEENSEKGGLYDVPIAIANAIRKFGQDLQICIPVIATDDYDSETDLVRVVPLTKHAFSMDGHVFQQEADEFCVPVKRFGIGKFLCVYPIKKGTTGWVFSSDRDTYGIKEKNSFTDIGKNEGPQDISSFDMGKYTQGFFIPDRWVSEKAFKLRLGHVYQSYDGGYDFSTSLGINLLNDDGKKRGMYLSDDCKATILNDKNQVIVDASADDSISTKMKLSNLLIEIAVWRSGKIIINGMDRKIEIDFNKLPEGEVMQIEPMWFPSVITNGMVKYEKRNVIVGSTVINS